MADCAFYLELMSQGLDGQLSPEGEGSLKRHLDDCDQCRLIHRQLCEIHEELSGWEEAEVPDGFTQRVMERIRGLDTRPAPKRAPLRVLRTLGPVAACAMLCVGLWRTQTTPAPDANTPQTRQTAPISEYAVRPASVSPVEERIAPETAPTAPGLVEKIAALTGQKPGLLLVVHDAPADLNGTWYAAEGFSVLIVQSDRPEEVFDDLAPNAALAARLGNGPLAILIWN